jgi:small conductance mechanosensitive channel
MSWLDQAVEFVPDPLLQTALKVAIIVAAAYVAYVAANAVIGRLQRAAEGRASQEGAKRRLNTGFTAVSAIVKGALVYFVAVAVTQTLGINVHVASRVLGIAVVAWVVNRVLGTVIRTAASTAEERLGKEERGQRVKTLILLGESVVRYVILFVAGLSILGQVGVDVRPLLAGAGIAGLAVGFGAQNLVRDVISGFFIIMEGQYAVGDLVKINGVFGKVERLGLRITAVRQPDGQLSYFPNGGIRTAENFTEDYVSYVVTIPVPREPSEAPLPAVKSVLADFEVEFRLLAAEPIIEVAELPSGSPAVRARMRVVPGRQTLLEQKLPARMKAGLERAGHPLPEGMEVGVSLRYPPPGAKA